MRPLALVTGGTGFVGRSVIRALDERGYRIRALIRAGSRNTLPDAVNYESIRESDNIFDETTEWWSEACQGVSAVVHLAWFAEPGKYLSSPLNRSCLTGTCSLAAGSIEARIQHFVGIGTCFEYDVSQGVLTTATALKPTTLYAATKTAAFLTLSQMFADAGIAFAWCRLFYLYGDGEDPHRLVPYIRSRIASKEVAELTQGNQIRDYTDVTDAARMIADVVTTGRSGPLNICSGRPITVRQLAESIADETDERHLLRFGVRRENLTDPPCVVGVPSLDPSVTPQEIVDKVERLACSPETKKAKHDG